MGSQGPEKRQYSTLDALAHTAHKEQVVARYEWPVTCPRVEAERRGKQFTYVVITPHLLQLPRSTWCSLTYHRTHRQAIEYVEAMDMIGYFAWCKPC